MRKLPALLSFALLGALAACQPSSTSTAAGATSVPRPITAPAVTPSAAATAVTRYPATWTLPDWSISPGAVQPGYTIKDICPSVNPALEAMRPSTAEKNKVYAAYGIKTHKTGQYEVDHIIPVELLGLVDASPSDPALNLYPEVNDKADPATIKRERLNPAFVENSKDILEDVLHRDVCAGTVPLAAAQHAIAADWRAAYVMYVGPPPGSAPALVTPSASATAVSHPVVRATSKAPVVQARPSGIVSTRQVSSGCYPKTSGGNCYRAGELCPKADHGASGVASNGEAITCKDNNGWRWEA